MLDLVHAYCSSDSNMIGWLFMNVNEGLSISCDYTSEISDCMISDYTTVNGDYMYMISDCTSSISDYTNVIIGYTSMISDCMISDYTGVISDYTGVVNSVPFCCLFVSLYTEA